MYRTFTRTSRRGAILGLAGLLAAAALAGCGGGDRPAVTYLALGDSAPFGYRLDAPGGYGDAGDFVGYPELIAGDRGLELLNVSCPGETTASFLDEDAVSLGCTNTRGEGQGYRGRYPLHAEYDGAQVDEAVRVLKRESGIGLVTLQLGANDLVLCVASGACGSADGVAAMADAVRENLDTVLATLREEGGYGGTIVVVNYYPPDYSDAAGTAVVERLDSAIAEAAAAHDAVVADAFAAYRSGSQADGGDVIAAGLVLPHDTHPTAAGQRLIARTVEQLL